MEFELKLENSKENRTQVISCELFNTDFEIPADTVHPDMEDYNLFVDAEHEYIRVRQQLEDAIARWNSIAVHYDTGDLTLGDILGITAMSNSAATCMIDNQFSRIDEVKLRLFDHRWAKIMHQEILNPMQSRMIIIYRLLVDQHLIKNLDSILKCLTLIKKLRTIVTELLTNTSAQSFCLRYHDEFHLYDDEDFEKFTFDRKAGDIFIAPTAIGYNYDNVNIERYGNNHIVRMTPNSFDLIDQETCYTGKLMFYCGSPKTHDQMIAEINHSLDTAWGGYKIRKTDISNKYDMLSLGLVKVGRFDPIPLPGYKKVVDYAVR
jgi:hypothetical protein